MAQRMPAVTSMPLARTAVASTTGRYGSRRARRDQRGISPTPAAESIE